jgi:hypothetical protein
MRVAGKECAHPASACSYLDQHIQGIFVFRLHVVRASNQTEGWVRASNQTEGWLTAHRRYLGWMLTLVIVCLLQGPKLLPSRALSRSTHQATQQKMDA